MTPQRKAFLTILVSILIGAVAGVLVDQAFLVRSFRVFGSSSPYVRFKQRVMNDLGLTPAQQAQLEQLLQRRQDAFNEFRKNIEAKYMEMRGATSDSIRGLLTPEQLSKFELLVKEFDSSYRHQEKR
jgi:Skp family chaperone for outer membrane proteins